MLAYQFNLKLLIVTRDQISIFYILLRLRINLLTNKMDCIWTPSI